jgi:hypothetical protein
LRKGSLYEFFKGGKAEGLKHLLLGRLVRSQMAREKGEIVGRLGSAGGAWGRRGSGGFCTLRSSYRHLLKIIGERRLARGWGKLVKGGWE